MGLQIDLDWRLDSVGDRRVDSMLGDDSEEIPRGTLRFSAELVLDSPVPECEWLLLEIGDNGYAQSSHLIFNNTDLGVLNGPWTPLRYCIPRSLLQKHNKLYLERTGNVWKCCQDQRERITCERDYDLTPAQNVELTEFLPLGKIVRMEPSIQGAVLTASCGRRIGLRFFLEGGLRITAADGGNPEETTVAESVTLVDGIEYGPAHITTEGETVIVSGPGAKACFKNDCNGDLILEIVNPEGVSSPGMRFLFAGSTSMLEWNLSEEEEIYGLGENAWHGMNKRGQQESIWVIHSFTHCDKPIPFMLSTEGYGLHLISSERAVFDLGARIGDTAWCWVDGKKLDFTFFPENDFRRMIRLYTSLTGRSPLPPRWAFGYWQSTTRGLGQEELENNIRKFDKQGFPIDVIAIDPKWQKPGFQCWLWDSGPNGKFPEPERFLSYLREHGLRLSLWSCPFLNYTSPLFEEALSRGYVFTDSRSPTQEFGKVHWWMGMDAALMDFSNPEAVEWFKEKFKPLVKNGVSVLKIDGGDNNETPVNLQSGAGVSMRELHNLYPVLFARAVYSAMEEIAGNERKLVWIRTGWSGIQRYPCAWGGDQKADFQGGRVLIRAGQQAGLAGISFWSHDLGGFTSRPTEEYYIRSYQWGLLNPLSRGHGKATAPWDVSERAARIIKQWLRFRYQLLPTLYSYAWGSHLSGEPMMRAMILDCQKDPKARKAEFQYRLGTDILVAPIYEEGGNADLSAEREIYLPSGQWYDLNSGELLEGGRQLYCRVPIEETPVYVRAGAIIVRGSETLRASELPEELTVEVYPGGVGHFLFYEDDGWSQAYREGKYITAEISAADEAEKLTVKLNARKGEFPGMLSTRKVYLVFPPLSPRKNIVIKINGSRASVAQLQDSEILSIDISDWWNTPCDRVVEVEYDQVGR